MDVVKREVDRIGGSVRIDSQEGVGTTITLSIPLTLAIIDGLLVRVGADRYVFPLAAVEACLELDESQDLNAVRFQERLLPIIDLRTIFAVEAEEEHHRQVVVASTDLGPVGFVVDTVIGDHQTVIKNLGALYSRVRGVSGATILGDGSVALILDLTRLAETLRYELAPSD
jgi:two-component system chemotaxis sensor kinase CheA